MARFDIGRDNGAEALLLAIVDEPMKLYVVPRSHLRNVSAIYIPGDGKYHPETGKRPAPILDALRECLALFRSTNERK